MIITRVKKPAKPNNPCSNNLKVSFNIFILSDSRLLFYELQQAEEYVSARKGEIIPKGILYSTVNIGCFEKSTGDLLNTLLR